MAAGSVGHPSLISVHWGNSEAINVKAENGSGAIPSREHQNFWDFEKKCKR